MLGFLLLLGMAGRASAGSASACFVGYVMDSFCINRGKLFDNPSLATLAEGSPAAHSIHCLVDISVCERSGYQVLRDLKSGESTHCSAWRLDDAGKVAMLALARATGAKGGCTTCTGDPNTGQKKGFRATFRGTFDPESKVRPRVLSVSEVLPASGCGTRDMVKSHFIVLGVF